MNNKNNTCTNCHSLLPQDSKFCPECGAKVEEIIKPEVITQKDNQQSEPTTRNIKEKKKTKNHQPMPTTAKMVLISLLTFLLGGCFMYAIIIFLPQTTEVRNIVASHKNVNISDSGIAESVAKVYDAVVVIGNYGDNGLQATGTGFVFKTDGNKAYIMTNNHVIANAKNVKVTFTNKQEEDATVVGSDTYSDIAVLSIDKSKILAVADIGSSKDMRVGDTTFAVGAPLDYQVYSWSVTRGILSGKDRLVEVSLSGNGTSDYVMNVLQTDTAINNGNSGGPLCNANGEVIGITNMKLASESIEGMGFAIPIETALEYANEFISGKPITRPYLGVSMYDVSSMVNGFFQNNIDTDLTEGVYINSVENDSPASKAGLQKGDIITKIDDVKVSSSAYLKYQLYTHKVGDTITITYYRNNKENTTKVTLESGNPTA